MIRACSFEEVDLHCGNCVYASSNGWIAPAIDCSKGQKGGYMYMDEEHCGTTCELFQSRKKNKMFCPTK